MTSSTLSKDLLRFSKATLTNQIARYAPNLYVNLTKETGRGLGDESVSDIADYFRRCFDDYRQHFADQDLDLIAHIRDRQLLEYGPGDIPAVALLMYAHGAAGVTCLDRFRLLKLTEKNQQVLAQLLASLPAEQAERAASAFQRHGDPASGFRKEAIRYEVATNGCIDTGETYALIYSRAVLEHVNDLDRTFEHMGKSLAGDGLGMHKVDLRSHGMHRNNPLDFLCWPSWAWSLMTSAKGAPNRWRINRYRELLQKHQLPIILLEQDEQAEKADIDNIRPSLARAFRHLPDEDLGCMTFWLIHGQPGPATLD